MEDKITEYFRRSYFAVDGLWFVKAEEHLGYQEALELDLRVWEVLPKVQARESCRLLGLEQEGLENFRMALELKLEGEEYGHSWEGNVLEVHDCPWLGLLRRSGRESIARDIGEHICKTDLQVWLWEFVEGFEVGFYSMMCRGEEKCIIEFAESD